MVFYVIKRQGSVLRSETRDSTISFSDPDARPSRGTVLISGDLVMWRYAGDARDRGLSTLKFGRSAWKDYELFEVREAGDALAEDRTVYFGHKCGSEFLFEQGVLVASGSPLTTEDVLKGVPRRDLEALAGDAPSDDVLDSVVEIPENEDEFVKMLHTYGQRLWARQ